VQSRFGRFIGVTVGEEVEGAGADSPRYSLHPNFRSFFGVIVQYGAHERTGNQEQAFPTEQRIRFHLTVGALQPFSVF
jgi:hypothetical protein